MHGVPSNVRQVGKIEQPLLLFSLLLLYLYLMIYVYYEAYTEIDRKDEDFMNCTCRSRDKSFYKSLFGLFTAFWIIGVFLWSVTDLYYQFW